MEYSNDSEQYYRDLCKQLSQQLQDSNHRHRNALREVRRARIVSALMKKLFNLKSARLSAEKIAERTLKTLCKFLSLECAAVYSKTTLDGGFVTMTYRGFAIEESCDLSRKSAMPEFAYVDAQRENSGVSKRLQLLTHTQHTVWCFNQGAGLAVLLGSNTDDQAHSWELSGDDREMLHAVLDLLANAINEADTRAQPLNPMIDEMTGLPNRHMVVEHLERESRNPGRINASTTTVMYLDLDRFRRINQEFGHAIGDKVLVAVSQRLKSLLRPGDMLGRMGVDEFAIIAPGLRVGTDAELIATRILEGFRKPMRIGGNSFYLSVSIGIAESSTMRTAIETFRDANLAMYNAKTNGGASFTAFGQEMRKPGPDIMRLEADLRLAVEREELCLYYQPIFSLQSNAVVALEALLRWHHPLKGILEPKEFMPIAEKSEIGLLMGDWVIDKVIRDLNIWSSENQACKAISICINIAESQFVQEDFVFKLGRKLRQGKIDPQRIRLEISEKTLQDCRSVDHDVLKKLRDMGVKVMLDDFGTGSSSLQRLQSLPIDTIKIDQKIVEKMNRGGQHSALISAMVSLARNLDKQIVAEGTENGAQLQELKKLGCDFAQGFLLCKPLAASKIGTFLGNQELAMGR